MATISSSFDLALPRRTSYGGERYIAGPTYETFLAHFGNAFPKPYFLTSDLGVTAVYDLPPPSKQTKRQVLVVHGANTPALGMLPLARELQAIDADTHVVLFDLWGHGLSSTPLVAHTPQIFHAQMLQILAHIQWNKAHILGFSFGGIVAVTFAVYYPSVPLSLTLIAPAGLMHKADRGPKMCELLDAEGRDPEAIECLFDWLEGGLVVPDGWEEKMRSGQVVAEALKRFSVDQHRGHQHSVLSIARDGGIFDREEDYRQLTNVPVDKIAVLGDFDEICTKARMEEFGMDQIEVLDKADHELVRTRAAEIAVKVYDFWAKK